MRPSRRLVSNCVFGLYPPALRPVAIRLILPARWKRASRAKNGHFGRSRADNFAKMR
jgi:hypothetical protein